MKRQKDAVYRDFRGAGIRLSEEPLQDMKIHDSAAELPMLYAYHMFDKAHLVMMIEENIIPREDGIRMLKALREMEKEGVEKVSLEVGAGMHSGETYLIRKLSEEVGGRLHLGRSTGDLGKVGLRAKLRDDLLKVMKGVNNFREVLIREAANHKDTVTVGMTIGQQSQPLTLGHLYLSWASALERDSERLAEVYKRINVSPTGSAIMTGSNFPMNRFRTAELLGFDSPAKNTHDAIMGHDFILEVMAVLAIINNDLGRWAADIALWTTQEFGTVDLPDRFCGTSSVMSQKKNPVAMGHIKGVFAQSVGNLITAFMSEKDPTGFVIYRHYAADTLWPTFDNTVRGLGWLTELIPTMKVNKALMKEHAGGFWAQATDVAGALVKEKGLPWRTAHQIVGILVRLSNERGIKPRDVDTRLLDEAALLYTGKPIGLSEETLKKALDPAEFVKGRTLYGGPAPEEVLRRIPDFEAILNQDRKKTAALEKQLQDAAEKLEKAIDALIR